MTIQIKATLLLLFTTAFVSLGLLQFSEIDILGVSVKGVDASSVVLNGVHMVGYYILARSFFYLRKKDLAEARNAADPNQLWMFSISATGFMLLSIMDELPLYVIQNFFVYMILAYGMWYVMRPMALAVMGVFGLMMYLAYSPEGVEFVKNLAPYKGGLEIMAAIFFPIGFGKQAWEIFRRGDDADVKNISLIAYMKLFVISALWAIWDVYVEWYVVLTIELFVLFIIAYILYKKITLSRKSDEIPL